MCIVQHFHVQGMLEAFSLNRLVQRYAFALYLGGAWSESWVGHKLPWLMFFVFFFSLSLLISLYHLHWVSQHCHQCYWYGQLRNHKAILDFSMCYQSPDFCCEVHCKQHNQLHLCSIWEQSAIYHGCSLLNQLLFVMLWRKMFYELIQLCWLGCGIIIQPWWLSVGMYSSHKEQILTAGYIVLWRVTW